MAEPEWNDYGDMLDTPMEEQDKEENEVIG